MACFGIEPSQLSQIDPRGLPMDASDEAVDRGSSERAEVEKKASPPILHVT